MLKIFCSAIVFRDCEWKHDGDSNGYTNSLFPLGCCYRCCSCYCCSMLMEENTHSVGWRKKRIETRIENCVAKADAFSFHVHHAHSFYLGWNIFHLYIVCTSNLSFHVFFAPSQLNAFCSVYGVYRFETIRMKEPMKMTIDMRIHTKPSTYLPLSSSAYTFTWSFRECVERFSVKFFSFLFFFIFLFSSWDFFFFIFSQNVLDGNSKWVQMCIILMLMMKMKRSMDSSNSTAGCWLCWDENPSLKKAFSINFLFRCWKLCFFSFYFLWILLLFPMSSFWHSNHHEVSR